jgi:hypothetical protein
VYRGGIVSFLIPDEWLEEYKDGGGGTFYEDEPESGVLRLNVLTMREPDRPDDRSKTDRLLALFSGSAQRGAVVRVLDNGNVICAYVEQAFQQNEELAMHYWEIANHADENHIRLAIFSFTILASRASDSAILDQIAMLDEQLPQTAFWKGGVASVH